MTGYMQITEDDMFDLLAVIAAIDGRAWADTDATLAAAAAWYETIRRELDQRRHFTLTRQLAEDAVYAWHGRDRRRITPADIIEVAAEIRDARLTATPLPDPPGYPGPGEYEAIRAAGRDVIADGGDARAAFAAMEAAAASAARQLNGGSR